MPARPGVDLLVVGAGPAGTSAAITAAREGLRVTLVDKAAFPRDKTCGDGLTTGALRLLESLGLRLGALGGYQPVRDTVLVSPRGRRIALPLPGGGERAGVVPRRDLDAALLALARSHGVEVRERSAFRRVSEEGDGRIVAVCGDGTELAARWLVAADGHFSAVRRDRTPRAPARKGEWSAFRQYFTRVETDRLWVLFDSRLLPGYAWVFPLPGGRANVGLGVLRGDGVDGHAIRDRWAAFVDGPIRDGVLGPHAAPEGPARAWPIPSAFDPGRLADGRVLYTGDAAGVVDPLTGEGIAQAVETGCLAARAIARADADPGAVARDYRHAVERALGPDLHFATMLQRVLAHPRAAEWCLRAVDLSPWTRRNFARWMYEDYPRALLFTPRRWRRGMFAGPGAFRA